MVATRKVVCANSRTVRNGYKSSRAQRLQCIRLFVAIDRLWLGKSKRGPMLKGYGARLMWW